MAELEIPISGLPSASLPLSGSEKVPMVQGGVTVEASTQDIANLGSGGGSSTFEDLTDSPYDNTQLATALNSKQDRLSGIVSGCVITVETFVGVGTNRRIRVTDGTWYIPTSEYTKATDTVSSEITLCETGGDFKYYDIVADTSGAIVIHEGTPSTAPAHYVINPLTEVLLGFITVGDAVIEEPSVIADSLEKKFEGVGLVTGAFTLDCESKDFPTFFIRLNGTSAALEFQNYWNVLEGTIYIDTDSTTTLTLPIGSKTGGSAIASKTFVGSGNYRITFGYLYGEYYFNFDTASGNTITDLSGIPTSTATANTLAFFDADKELISATDILLGTLGIAKTQEFDLAFNGSATAFTKTHNLNNTKAIHYTIQMPDGTLVQQNEDGILEYTVTKTATTITITFAVAPSAGTGYLTVTGIQKEAVVPPSGAFTADSTTITADSTLVTADEL